MRDDPGDISEIRVDALGGGNHEAESESTTSRDELREKYFAQAGYGPHLLNSSGWLSAVEYVNKQGRLDRPNMSRGPNSIRLTARVPNSKF